MGFELDLIHWLQSFSNSFLDFVFQLFTVFGEEEILIVLLGFIYWCYDKKIGELMGLTIFVSLALNSMLKLVIARQRPFVVDNSIVNIRPSTSGGYSFPSGHTQTAATTYFSIYYALKKRWVLILAIVITTLVAISRMYLGVHYLTDVLAGAFIGILISYFIMNKLKDEKKLVKLYQILLLLSILGFIVVIIYNIIKNQNLGVFDSYQFYFDSEDLAKMFGTLTGFTLAILFEKTKVNFVNHKDKVKNIVRFVIGLAIIMLVRYALKFVFGIIVDGEELVDNQMTLSIFAAIFDYLRYFAMLFIGIGLYPMLFKKYKF